MDKPREECGVFAVAGKSQDVPAASYAYLGLYALQHRGQESCGIASSNGDILTYRKGMGLVSEVFREREFDELKGHLAIGHVRYSTTGDSQIENAQPIVGASRLGKIAVAHNGNLVNTQYLKSSLEREGVVFQSSSDSEFFLHLAARSGMDRLEEAVLHATKAIEGAYSLVVLSPEAVVSLRDPLGMRPLVVGENQDAYFFASETCALDAVGASYVKELAPGEMAAFRDGHINFIQALPSTRRAMCIFEFIYFARTDSVIGGKNVHLVRKKLGETLAKESPCEADMVIAAPDSGISAAIGFAEESGISYDTGLSRNRYIGRTFIQPTQELRELGVKIKLNPIADLVRSKRVVVVDDSIVRGTTSAKALSMLRAAGAREVIMYVASPPIKYPCFYGIDTPDRRELIAAQYDTGRIAQLIGADRLSYLSVDGLLSVVGPREEFCLACLTGEYPTRLPDTEGGALK